MEASTCARCGKPLKNSLYSYCPDCRDANNATLAVYAHYRNGKVGLWLVFATAFWLFSSWIWLVVLWTLQDVTGLEISRVFALLVPVVLFVLFFILRWGGTGFNLWPRSKSKPGAEGAVCVTCGSVGESGAEYTSRRFGPVYICNRCVHAGMRDNRLGAALVGFISVFFLVGAGSAMFSPNLGVTTTSAGGMTTTITSPVVHGLAGTVVAYAFGVVLMLGGLAVGYFAMRFVLARPTEERRQRAGQGIAQ